MGRWRVGKIPTAGCSMSQWFEVKVTTVMIILVEVPDKTWMQSPENQAIDVALDEAPMTGTSEAEAAPIPAKFVESCIRHADIVRTIDGMEDKG